MRTDTRKEELVHRVTSLIGQRVAGVRYFTLPDEPDILQAGGKGQPWREFSDRFDYLEYGLDLVMEDGRVFGITWGSEFAEYGLSLVDNTIGPMGDPTFVWDVGETTRWKPLLHRTITEAELFWSWWEDSDGRTYYPFELDLAFDSGGRVVLVSATYSPDTDAFFPAGDAVTVFFDRAVAEWYGFGIGRDGRVSLAEVEESVR